MLFRIVLQDALSEVLRVCLPLKLKVFVEENHSLDGRAKQGVARHCREGSEVDKEGGGRAGCEAANHGRRRRREAQGDSVGQQAGREVSGVQQVRTEWVLQPMLRQWVDEDGTVGGKKAKARRKKCDVRFSFPMRNRVFQKNYMRIGVRQLLRMCGEDKPWA